MTGLFGSAARLAFQAIIGTGLFVLLLGLAAGLGALTHFCVERGWFNEWLAEGAYTAEKLIFYIDMALYGLFLIAEALTFLKDLWKAFKKP